MLYRIILDWITLHWFRLYLIILDRIAVPDQYMWTYRHAEIHTCGELDIWTCVHVDMMTCREMDIWTFGHMDMWTFRHTDIHTYGYVERWTFGFFKLLAV